MGNNQIGILDLFYFLDGSCEPANSSGRELRFLYRETVGAVSMVCLFYFGGADTAIRESYTRHDLQLL
jgi:hypothetical protein